MTQANLARMIETSPNQLGNYLKGQGSLTERSLNKCFDILDINVDKYKQQYNIALKAAQIFNNNNTAFDEVMRMTKDTLISKTSIEEIKFLIDVNTEDEYEEIIKCRIVDYQSTIPYFKAMVVYLMNSSEKVTSKNNVNTWSLLFGAVAIGSVIVTPISLLSMGIKAGISAAIGTVGGAILSNITKENKPLEPFKELSKKMLNNLMEEYNKSNKNLQKEK